MMFTVFSDKEIFEEIVLFSDDYPNWYNIFKHHSEVCLNITNEEFEAENLTESVIFEFIKSTGRLCIIPLKEFFDQLEEDETLILEKPRAAFFLDISDKKANELQNKFGILVQSKNSLNDKVLEGYFFKELSENTVIKYGWVGLCSNFELPPSNCLVVTDNWLLKNEENRKIIGEQNIIDLIDSLLPRTLDAEFQIFIITSEQNRTAVLCENISNNIKDNISKKRDYPIRVEILFSETEHKRKIISNYYSIVCDRGFAMFCIDDKTKVKSKNDFRYEGIFQNVTQNKGDTVHCSNSIFLKDIKEICKTAKEINKNSGELPNYRFHGDCRTDKIIRNRLIKDV